MNSSWRYALTSVIGTSHLKTGQGCQDASDCRTYRGANGHPVLVAIASDGAGSAKFAEAGSRLACETVMAAIGEFLETGGMVSKIDAALAAEWLGLLQCAIRVQCSEHGATARDFACTLLAAVVDVESAAFFQIGDGCIIVRGLDEDEFLWVFWPERGEYENVTFFATEPHAHEHLQFESVRSHVTELAVLTDGLQRLALHYESGTAHGPFFRGLFEAFGSVAPGRSDDLSRSLAKFLGSERVNSRTDDDKTLILASRTGPAPSANESDADTL